LAHTPLGEEISPPAAGDVQRRVPRQGTYLMIVSLAGDAHVGRANVNAGFFALAFGSALNPKLLAIDVLLARNRRRRAMFLAVLLAGFAVAATIGLVDVLVVQASATIEAQRRASAAVDVALGTLLVIIGALVLTRWLRQRRALAPAAGNQPRLAKGKNGWTERLLREPRLGLGVLVGAIIGLPGAFYLTALHRLVAGNWSTATQVAAVIIFVVIELMLIIIPFLFLEFRPERTMATLERSQGWLLTHARLVVGSIALALGAYLVITAIARLT
jgi:Sap-like sulfolipid-1-addressing protein